MAFLNAFFVGMGTTLGVAMALVFIVLIGIICESGGNK